MKKKNCEFWDFFGWWSLQRGQLNKSPCGWKKTLQNPKKIPNSIKLDPLSCPLIPVIFKKETLGLLFLLRFVKNWEIPEFTSKQTFWRFNEDVYKILRYKISKKPTISQNCVLESFPFTPYIFIKRYTWSINFETLHWKLSISWTYSEINLAS